MQIRKVGRYVVASAVLSFGTFAVPSLALAQMSPEEEQRCVWQCLANSPGGAASKAYQRCVDTMCVAPHAAPASPPPSALTPSARSAGKWTSGSGKAKGSSFAGVEVGGQSFTFICKLGGPGLLAVAGLRGPVDAVAVRIDDQNYGLPFTAQNGFLYTNATSHLLAALMNGKAVHVSNTRSGASATFPLSGSGSAIRKALAGCRM